LGQEKPNTFGSFPESNHASSALQFVNNCLSVKANDTSASDSLGEPTSVDVIDLVRPVKGTLSETLAIEDSPSSYWPQLVPFSQDTFRTPVTCSQSNSSSVLQNSELVSSVKEVLSDFKKSMSVDLAKPSTGL
jgi:hypothetical protein